MKANPHPDIVTTAARTADGIEVASAGELATATATHPAHLVFGGPAKTDQALTAALHTDIPTTINVESVHELRRLNHIAHHHGRAATIALRVNRRHGTDITGSHRMTGTATPFGIDETELDAAIHETAQLDSVRLTGIHLHTVSNNLDAARHADHVHDCLRFTDELARRHRIPLETVNVGGGIGVDMTGNRQFDLTEFGRRLRNPPTGGRTIVLEPGRYLAADIGWYATEVLDLKRNHDRDFAVVRGGTHHFRLPAAWGYHHPGHVHPVDTWPYPWSRPTITNRPVDVCGELCTPRDVLTRDLPVTRLRVGDVLVWPRTGAYGWTISHHDFLSHPHPDTIVLTD